MTEAVVKRDEAQVVLCSGFFYVFSGVMENFSLNGNGSIMLLHE